MAPLTPAEKQKRYRDRLRQTYPEKYSTILKNNAERNRKYRKKVKESTTTEEKNKQRLKWREKKRTERKKDSNNTASDEERKFTQQRAKRRIYRMWIAKKAQYESKINVLNKTVNRLRKQNARLMKKLAQFEELLRHPEDTEENIITPEPNENNMTPLSKSCAFIDQNLPNVTSEEKEKVKRVLLDHNILTNAVQDAYKNTKSNNERNIFKKITEHEYVTKYKMKRKVSLILGLKGRARRLKQYENKRNKKTVEEIRQFYERDDVSRATAGKKEVKTSKKEKRQRRYLLKTQKDLFKKYKDEGGTAKYSTFKKHRPFYVLHPKLSNRDTCACVKHENFIFKTEKLHTLAMIDTKNVEDILAKVMCDPNSKDCAYRQCSTCRDNDITFDWAGYSKDEMVMWEEFAREKHEYVDKNSGHNKTTEKMVKREKSGTMVSLTDSYNSDLNTFSKHVYNIKHQYSQYVSCIKNLTTNEVVVHIDFSENYTCKYAKEVQTMHWGASKPQITIHTGVIYAKNKEPQTFASISPNNEHGPEAIWAHLTPILQYIRKILPNITGIHFFSDGPTSQYKQKKNFYFFSKLMEEMGFPNSTWNFSEASHGKGAADGVGAAVKRRLDNCVSQGMDVPNAETAYDILQNSDSSVLTFYVPQDSIQNFSVDADLIPVPQTMTLHQIVKTESVNTIRYRCLSCFCCDMISFKGSCNCLNIKYHKLYNEQKQRQPTASIREGEKNSLEMDGFEKKKKIPKKTIKTEKTVRNKIQMLSDVRYLPENQSYIDLNKFDASKFITIPVETDLLRSKKNKTPDDIYKTPVPSTSKEGLMATKKSEQKNLKRKRPQFSDDSTDTDTENFSVHDSSDYCYEEEFLDEEFLDEELLRLPIEQNEIKTTGPGKRTKIGGKRTRKYDEIIMSESSGTTHESFERSGPEKLRKHLEQPCLTPSTSHDSLKRSGPANAQKDPEEVHQRRRGTSHDSLEDFEPENAQIDPVETGQPKETSLQSPSTSHETFERSGPENFRKHLEEPCLTTGTSHESLKRSGPANAQKDPEEVYQRRRGTSHDSLEDFGPENAQIDTVETGQPKETSLQSPSTSHETFERSGPENFRKHLEEPCLTTGTSHESLKRSGPANAQKDPEEVYQRRRGTSHDSLEDFGPENAQIDTVETGQPKETSLQSPSTSHETFERSGPENFRKHLEEPCLTTGTSHESLKRSGPANAQKDPEEVYQRRRGTSHDSLEDFGPENAQIDTVETGQPKETSLQSPSTSHETFERSGPENLRKHLEEPCLTPGTSHDSLKRSGAENSQDHLKTTSLTPGVPHNSSDMTPIKKKVSIDGLVIPSPFKRNLFWPDEIDSKKKKRKIKEKIPSAIGSSAWRNYHQNKESEKQRKIAEKERRAEERKEKLKKKEEQEKQKKKKMGKKQSYEPISSDDTDMEVKYSKSDDSPYDVEMDVSSSSKKLPYSETKRKSKEAAILSGSDSDDMPLCRLSVNTEKTKGISKGCYVIITYEGEYFPGVVENVDRDYFEVSTMTFSTGNTYRWPDKPDKIWYAKKDIIEKIENPVLCNKRGFYTVKEMEKFLTFTT